MKRGQKTCHHWRFSPKMPSTFKVKSTVKMVKKKRATQISNTVSPSHFSNSRNWKNMEFFQSSDFDETVLGDSLTFFTEFTLIWIAELFFWWPLLSGKTGSKSSEIWTVEVVVSNLISVLLFEASWDLNANVNANGIQDPTAWMKNSDSGFSKNWNILSNWVLKLVLLDT